MRAPEDVSAPPDAAPTFRAWPRRRRGDDIVSEALRVDPVLAMRLAPDEIDGAL